jgi:hypothetical protein
LKRRPLVEGGCKGSYEMLVLSIFCEPRPPLDKCTNPTKTLTLQVNDITIDTVSHHVDSRLRPSTDA